MIRISKVLKSASKILTQVLEAQQVEKPVVFLGGTCEEPWRDDLKKIFPTLYFIDPYDDNWDPKDNIYDELAGMMVADYVVFFKGGDLSKKEKKFLEIVGQEDKLNDFNSLEEVKGFLTDITSPKKVTLACTLKKIAQQMGKKAWSPTGWLPGRGPQPLTVQQYHKRMSENRAQYGICSRCGSKIRLAEGPGNIACPRCGTPLNRF